jgi:hypothetical protein
MPLPHHSSREQKGKKETEEHQTADPLRISLPKLYLPNPSSIFLYSSNKEIILEKVVFDEKRRSENAG